MRKLNPQDQIAYIPLHADGDITHPDVEFGFVTSVKDNTVFCRFWRTKTGNELRTTANSQGCNIESLRYHISHSKLVVQEAWNRYVEPKGGK